MVEIYTVNKITKSDALCDEDYVLATDYDTLEAENAELKKQCAAFHAEASDHYRASIAANATLAALRDLFAPDKVISNSTCMKAVDILYPTPENDND